MQFLDVTRALKLALGDTTVASPPIAALRARLYYVERPPSELAVGAAVVQTKDDQVGALRLAIASSPQKRLKARHAALLRSMEEVVRRHGWLDIPAAVKREFDMDLVEITLVREVLHSEPLVFVDDPRPSFLKKVNSSRVSQKEVKRALKDSGMKASTGQSFGCSNCGIITGGLLRCGRCKGAVYCGRPCQVAHWKAHKGCCGA